MTASDCLCESTATAVGRKLRSLRLEAGLSQAELATPRHATQSATDRLERGPHRISLVSINRVAGALGRETVLLIQQKQSV